MYGGLRHTVLLTLSTSQHQIMVADVHIGGSMICSRGVCLVVGFVMVVAVGGGEMTRHRED